MHITGGVGFPILNLRLVEDDHVGTFTIIDDVGRVVGNILLPDEERFVGGDGAASLEVGSGSLVNIVGIAINPLELAQEGRIAHNPYTEHVGLILDVAGLGVGQEAMSCEVGDHEDAARNGVVTDDLFPVGRAVLTVLALELGLAHELNLADTGLPDGRAVAVVDTVPIPECAQVGIIVTPSPHDGHVGKVVIVIILAVVLAFVTLRSAGRQHLVDGVKAVDGSGGSVALEVERLVQGEEVIMLYISVTVKLQLGQFEEVIVQNAVAAAVEGIVVDSGFLLHIHLN